MNSRTKRASLLWLLGFLQFHTAALAGECSEGSAFYIARLASGPWTHVITPEYCFYCLRCPAESDRWAGPIAAARFAECKKNSLREKLIQAASRYLEQEATTDSLKQLQYEAAITLAYWGIGHLGTRDIFSILTRGTPHQPHEFHQTMMALAVLDDPRTTGFVVAAYDSIRARDQHEERELLVAALNCLYHVSSKEAALAASRIALIETDPALRERAMRVVRAK